MDIEKELSELKAKVDALPGAENKLSMVVFSGDLDKQLASLIIATGAAAMGMKVVLFYTFWGNGGPPRSRQEGRRQVLHGENVRLHAP